MSAWVRVTTRIYKRLVRWFPHEFQIRHGDDLENLGEDSAAHAEALSAFLTEKTAPSNREPHKTPQNPFQN